MRRKMNLQLFASDLKGFNEKRNALIGELESLIGTAETETRALTQEENEMYEKILAEIKALEKTIGKAEEQRNLALSEKDGEGKTETRSAEDIVDDFVKGRELRAGEMSTTENGNVYIITSDIYRTTFTLWHQTSGKYNKIAKDTSPVPLYEIADKHAKGEYDGQS